MDLSLFRPRGVLLCSPMGSKDLRRLSMRLPNAYRWIPFQGRLIDKPVLRMMLARRLPELIWRRGGRSWLNSPPQSYALRYARPLRELIGSPGSHLVRTGIVNPALLAKTLGQSLSIRRNAEALISSAMVELFCEAWKTDSVPRGKVPRMPLLSLADHATFDATDEAGIILDTRAGVYFTLNATATIMLQAALACETIDHSWAELHGEVLNDTPAVKQGFKVLQRVSADALAARKGGSNPARR